jgi:predicted CoA-substrate-specific enzyme activase
VAKCYLGIDVGSVSTNIVVLDEEYEVLVDLYLRTGGQPLQAVQGGLRQIRTQLSDVEVVAVGTTGSGRQISGVMVGADVIKNEITAHAVASQFMVPDVRTVLEIGGQDSKIIILRDGVVVDFAMNSVCAAGTGSFLDRQASRLGVPIEEFGGLALRSVNPVRIAGRCAVFAESDMIHKQQTGHSIEDITRGLCQALVRNYLNNVGKGKDIHPPVVFQGGVAANVGIVAAFEEALGYEIHVPKYYNVMGAIGAAMLAREAVEEAGGKTTFRGFEVSDLEYRANSFECNGCPNNCEIIEFYIAGKLAARWGGRCDKWDHVEAHATAANA